MNVSRHTLRLLSIGIIIMLGLGMNSCNKDTKLAKFYHNVTARFNGYFNAKTKYAESMSNIEDKKKDDFNEILPIFVDTDEKEAAEVGSEMDIVITKCTRVISKHDISKWIDDSYLLVGKAYFQKQEYFEAIEAFTYVYDKYKREPIRYEALLWLIKSYMATDQAFQAEQAILTAFTSKNKLPEYLKDEMYLARAQLQIENKKLPRGY